jgi:hypothetical protein
MKKPLLIPVILASASLSSTAVELIDSPGPGYRHQIETQMIESALPRQMKVVPNPSFPKVRLSLPLTHPKYEPFPAAALLKHSASPLSPSVTNAFSEPIRFTAK